MVFPPPISRDLPSLFQRSNSLVHLLQLHSLLLKTGLDQRPSFASQTISSLCPLSLPHARFLFDRLPFPPPLFAWNTVIRAYAKSHSSLEAVRLFLALRSAGIRPDNFTYPFVLKACACSSLLRAGGAVHGLVLKVGFLSDLYVGNALLHMYACCGLIGSARRVFGEMGVRDVVSWSSMIEGCVACDRPLDAFTVFQQMRQSDIKPNSVTLVSLLSASSHLGSLTLGQAVYSYVMVHEVKMDVALASALIGMYAKCGHVDKAFQVFNSMEEKNLQTWTIMTSGFADHGKGKEAIALFNQMERSGVKPDSKSFSIILCACSHLGLVDEGQNLFRRMVSVYNIQPTMEHYGCMVDLFGRAGLVEIAYEFIKNMPFAPNGVILRSFLGACRKYGEISNIDGKLNQILKLLLKDEPDLGANYVLAANVSALSGKWTDVAALSSHIAERSLKKAPGCSWLEVNKKSLELERIEVGG